MAIFGSENINHTASTNRKHKFHLETNILKKHLTSFLKVNTPPKNHFFSIYNYHELLINLAQ